MLFIGQRLFRPKREAFERWKFMVKFNFPMFPRKRRYKAIIYELLQKKELLQKRMRIKSIYSKHSKKKKKLEYLKNIDQIEFFRVFTNFHNLLYQKVKAHYRDFFFQAKFYRFLAVQIRKKTRQMRANNHRGSIL